jgi:hypothetical protein
MSEQGSGFWQQVLKVIIGSPKGVSRKTIAKMLELEGGKTNPKLLAALDTLGRAGRIRESMGRDDDTGSVEIIVNLIIDQPTKRDIVGMKEEPLEQKDIDPKGIQPVGRTRTGIDEPLRQGDIER